MNKRPLLVVTAIALILLILWWSLGDQGNTTRYVSGTIEADEVRLASRYGGRVRVLHAREGDSLRGGTLVATLDAPELKARRDQAAATLAELQNGARPEEIAAGRAEWEALQAELQFARNELKRAEDLFVEKTISATERDRAASRSEELEKQVTAAKQRHDLLLAGTRKERIDQAQAELAAIDAQLLETRISTPLVIESAAESPALTQTVVYSLETLPIKVGDVLAPNQTAASLLRADQLWVRVYVPELWLGRITIDQRVTVRIDSHPDREFEGKVEQINRKAEFTPRNVQTAAGRVKQVFGVKIRLPVETGILKAGMGAEVYFPDMPPIPTD